MRSATGFLAAIVLLAASCVDPRAGADRPAGVAIPIVRAHGLIFVEVERGSEPPLLALLDTGASASAIAPERARDLRTISSSEVVGTTGSVAAEDVELEGLRLGAFAIPALRATRRSLAGLLSPDRRAVELILGSDAFAGVALTLDFRTNVLEVSSSGPESEREAVPMELDNGIPTIPATLAGVETSLRVDTGASLFDTPDVYVNVPPRMWEMLRARDPALAPSTHFQGTGAGGQSVELPVARVSQARIGPKAFDSVFVIAQPEAGYFADPRAKGFVGNNFLEKLGRLTID